MRKRIWWNKCERFVVGFSRLLMFWSLSCLSVCCVKLQDSQNCVFEYELAGMIYTIQQMSEREDKGIWMKELPLFSLIATYNLLFIHKSNVSNLFIHSFCFCFFLPNHHSMCLPFGREWEDDDSTSLPLQLFGANTYVLTIISFFSLTRRLSRLNKRPCKFLHSILFWGTLKKGTFLF